MSDKLIKIGRNTLHYILTAASAIIGVYIAIQLNMNSMKKDIESCEKTNIELKKGMDTNGQSIHELQINQINIINQGKFDTPYLQFTKPRGGNLSSLYSYIYYSDY